MKTHFRSLKPSVYKFGATLLSFLVPFIAICIMFGCEQDYLTSEPVTDVSQLQTEIKMLPGFSSKSNLMPEKMMSILSEPAALPESAAGLATGKTVKIGMIIEDEFSPYTKYGAELAMFEINQAGGVLGLPADTDNAKNEPNYTAGKITGGVMGYPIALIIKDNQDDPALSAELTEEMIKKDKVLAIIGPAYSRNALDITSIAQFYEVPLVTTEATRPEITSAGDYVFMAASTTEFQGQTMARFAWESLNARKAALFIQSGEPESEGNANAFKDNFMTLGGAIVNTEYYSEGDTVFNTQLESIAANAPDVIYMPGFPPEVPIAINQARITPQQNATGITATFLGGDGWDFVELITMGGAAVEGSYYTAFYATDSPTSNNNDFIDAYQRMFGTDPEVDAALGYDALRLIATAIRRAGSLDAADIRDELAATYDYRGATHIHRYDENRHPEKSIVIKCISKGKAYCYKLVEP